MLCARGSTMKNMFAPHRALSASASGGSGTERKSEMKTLGYALLILGLAGVVFGGIEFDRQRTILQIGAMSASVTEHQTTAVVPVAGLLAMGGGVALVLVSQRKRRA